VIADGYVGFNLLGHRATNSRSSEFLAGKRLRSELILQILPGHLSLLRVDDAGPGSGCWASPPPAARPAPAREVLFNMAHARQSNG
jgi:hypothetical protein